MTAKLAESFSDKQITDKKNEVMEKFFGTLTKTTTIINQVDQEGGECGGIFTLSHNKAFRI